jgi:hypothetical protein
MKKNKIFDWLSSTSIYKNLIKHAELASLIAGSLIIGIWTFVLFFAKPSTFDLVGQQLLSHQWIAGFHNGATIGPTNYILKMVLFYIPADYLPGSPRLKLILLTLLINLLTYILLVLILKKLWKLFFPKLEKKFYLATLWMASIAGSMYWIQFSNSRNLEIVGGLYLIYLGCSLKNTSRYTKYLLIFLLSSVLFFADPLQLYMSAIPLIIYSFIHQLPARKPKIDYLATIKLSVSVALGYLFSKVFIKIAEKVSGVHFISVTSHTNGYSMIETWKHGLVPMIKQLGRLYVGGYQLGRTFEAINLLFVVAVVIISVFYVYKRLIPKKFVFLLLTFWLVDIAFYITSGQSLQSGTSRYLIMTVPLFVLLISLILSTKHKLKNLIMVSTLLVVLANCIGLVNAMSNNWNPKFTKDAHIYSVINYVSGTKNTYTYASMDSALPADYFSNNKVTVLPLSCNPGGVLSPSYLFFDASFYKHLVSSKQINVALILDGSQITNTPSICSLQNIVSQLGLYKQVQHLDDGSTVLIYSSSQITKALGL